MNPEVAFDERLVQAVRTAIQTARGYGYAIEQMTLSLSLREGSLCACYFAPASRRTLGGDVTITVDMASGCVTEVVRGQ